ncbi:MAG: hypothetical protein Tsb0027_22270 [Wenzhouxiangellaceae bacterium]
MIAAKGLLIEDVGQVLGTLTVIAGLKKPAGAICTSHKQDILSVCQRGKRQA